MRKGQGPCDIYNRRRQERAAALAMAIVALVLIFVAALGIGRTAILPRVVLEILGQSLFGLLASSTRGRRCSRRRCALGG